MTAARPPYLVLSAQCVAGAWFAVAIITVLVMTSRKPAQPFQMLRQELQRDMDAIKDGRAMKHADAQGAMLAPMTESRAELIGAHLADEPLA
ncbi:hypothetical protein [Caballeronia pedi]|uniref:hypothetical protein n=1 Tax=Caballeronia pedi TaxID=1777141 RepID=UPI001ABFE646|nr:hypothetical protein [Caballeronia pedi]